MGCQKIAHTPGSKSKSRRHVDSQSRFDDLFVTMNSETSALSDAMKSIAKSVGNKGSGSTESPNKRKRRAYKELTESIMDLVTERKAMVDASMPIDDVDDQLAILQRQRKSLNEAETRRSPHNEDSGSTRRNLVDAFKSNRSRDHHC